jgi:hypothetical protein
MHLSVNKGEIGPWGRDGLVRIAPCYGLDDAGIKSRWEEIYRILADRPWGQPSLVNDGYHVSFPGGGGGGGVNRPGVGVHTHPPQAPGVEQV